MDSKTKLTSLLSKFHSLFFSVLEEHRRSDGKLTSKMDRNGVWRFPEGSGRQGRVERYCCNVICGVLTTSEVKGLR